MMDGAVTLFYSLHVLIFVIWCSNFGLIKKGNKHLKCIWGIALDLDGRWAGKGNCTCMSMGVSRELCGFVFYKGMLM